MEVYLIRKRNNSVDARGVYDPTTGALTVLKGSKVSGEIRFTKTFRGAKTIDKLWDEHIEGTTVKADVTFKSASTAANFVTGGSTNGLTAWKTKEGKTIKEAIKEISG